MKFLDKLILCLFSAIILMLSVFSCFVIFGWADATTIFVMVTNVLKNTTTCNVLIGMNVILILLAIKGLFFESRDKEENYKDGILLENEDGKLLITRDTLNSMVDSVVSGFEGVKKQQSRIMLDQNNDVSIVLTIEVTDDVVIKELSNNIQMRVKDAIKKSLDVEVKSLDIRIKNVVKPEDEKSN